MKKLTLATLSTLALTLTCSSVFAVDGTITVNGVVTDGTCTLQKGGGVITGLKNLTVSLPTLPKSTFTPTNPIPIVRYGINMFLTNATGTANCDAATTQAFKGIHLSVSSPNDDLDGTDKTFLVNKLTNAPNINPVFIRIYTDRSDVVDISAPWGKQAKSPIRTFRDQIYLQYFVGLASKSGVVDAQNVQAVVNYTLMYN
ncbi:MAG: fimbrial protein [Acinetobacter guillouiae]|uniref:fimbrial protein n=1 Tax=Acinetobacter guillouiae TaxID=106649 RepID=UPI001CD56818|nr:type 1 fimbrial protein [Acinetobacter guillouiae]